MGSSYDLSPSAASGSGAADDPSLFLSLSDLAPGSPSDYLDLPPTPLHEQPPQQPKQEKPPSPGATAGPEDLVLPFISRMLMEEDIDDKFFYQFPDHPALLTVSSDSTSATTNANSSGNTFSPSFSYDTPASADPVWPYDPVELSQLLRSPPYSDDMVGVGLDDFAATDSVFALPGQDATAAAGFHQSPAASFDFERSGFMDSAEEANSATLPGADGDHATLASAFFGGGSHSGVNMDMLNLAFLKGMEEANKFLPTTSSLFIDLEATTSSGDTNSKPPATGFTDASKVKEEEVMDTTPMFGGGSSNGRGRKSRPYEDDLEAEAGRTSKVMMPEQEESGAREMFDEIMACTYEEFMKRMEDLRIAKDNESEKNSRRGKRQGASEVVDLRTMLIHCAQAVATGDQRGAVETLKQIKQHSSPRGDSTQRLAHCFAEGLDARLAGTGSMVYQSLMAKRTSVVEFLKAYRLFMAASCFKKVKIMFSNMTMCHAVAGRSKLHIVEYGVQYGLQWPGFLRSLANREGGPPEVRFTGIDLPQPGFRPAYQIEETGHRLSKCAREFGVPFKFRAIAAKWETVCAEDLNLDPNEVLVVNSECSFSNLMDESIDVDSPSSRDMVLHNIRKMRPNVFIQSERNGTYGAPFFLTRFREALFFYSAHFDMLDATIPRDSDERLLIERDIFGRAALNVIACEGADRMDRPETYKQCQMRNQRAGLRQLPLNPEVVKAVRDKVKSYHKDFLVDQDHRWLLQGWKGRVLYAMSTWDAEDNNSTF